MATPKLSSTSITSLCSSPLVPPPSMPLAPRLPPQTLGGVETHCALPSAVAVVLAANRRGPVAASYSRPIQGLARPQLDMAEPGQPLPATAGSHEQARTGPSNALLPCCNEERAKDRGHELEEVGGPKCEALTQRNSTEKGLFADV